MAAEAPRQRGEPALDGGATALLEVLVRTDELVTAASAVVRWLTDDIGGGGAACLRVEGGRSDLVAARGALVALPSNDLVEAHDVAHVRSFELPGGTFVHVHPVCRESTHVRALLVVTSDVPRQHATWAAGLLVHKLPSDVRRFVACLSHEIRTPLNVVLGNTSMLLQGVGGPLTDAQHRMLTRIESSGRHLLSLVNDVLDIARMDAGKMIALPADMSIARLIAEIAHEMDVAIASSGLRLVVDVDPALPQVRSDRQKLKQVLLNLLGNAVKFTPAGSITLSARAVRNGVAVTVRDTGIGIDKAELPRIFEDFHQVRVEAPGRDVRHGAGLGLAISRRLCALVGATLEVESVLGEGSTFTVHVPSVPPRG